jgi:acetyltransferase-like isoleucine patch superfamily enzyme
MTTYVNRELFNGELKNLETESSIHIGHDVWIGQGVIILLGLNIGNGAILAAGSVITMGVEPYSLVVGNPAKPLRKRFSDELIEDLQTLKWGDKSDKELESIKPMFFRYFSDSTMLPD